MTAGFFVVYHGEAILQFFTNIITKDQSTNHVRACSQKKITTQPDSLPGGNASPSSGTQESVFGFSVN